MNPIFEKPSRGFTLIELMVVIAIITVLTLIAIPHHRHGADRSSWRACHSTNMTLQSALELYSMDNPASSASILPGNPTMPDNLLFRRGYARQITPYNNYSICSYYSSLDASGTQHNQCVLHGEPVDRR